MGKKRPSVRTLPSGERVRHDPDGEQHLAPQDKAQRFLKASADQIQAVQEENRRALAEALADKRARLDAGDAVPHDKRPI